MSRASSGGVLPSGGRRKGAVATAADLYSTHSGFRFLTNFVFFGWLTLLCLLFSQSLGPSFPPLKMGELPAPLNLDVFGGGGSAPSAASPAAQGEAHPVAAEAKGPALLDALGAADPAAPVLADYRLEDKGVQGPADAVASLRAGRAALGRNSPPDVEAGYVQLKSAADAGLAPAMALYGLARMAPPGGVAADASAGREWLRRAAQAGDAQAARLLARAYLTGSAGFPAPDKARELFRRGQELGDAASSLELARLLAAGVGGPADVAQAEQTVRIAAERGDPAAMGALGRYLVRTAATAPSPSYDEAILWLTRSADRGDTAAMERLGDIHMFLAKAPPVQDPAQGFSWYARCAAAGRTACHFAVGRAYAMAVGVAPDLPRAWAHLTLARNAGHPKAAAELDALEARMSTADRQAGMSLLTELQSPGR
jgi:TPR repeat protein